MAKTRNYSKRVTKKKKNRNRKPQPWLWIGVGIVAALILIAVLWIKPWQLGGPAEISIERAYEEYQKGTFFLDVRKHDEWDQVHLSNSVLIPLDELEGRLDELPRDQDIVIICRSGNRSRQARDILVNAGINRVSSMRGGINKWKAAGYPVQEVNQ